MPASLQNKVIVITGASSGIGLALAKRACVLGAMVVLAARSEDKLLSLAGELGKERLVHDHVKCHRTECVKGGLLRALTIAAIAQGRACGDGCDASTRAHHAPGEGRDNLRPCGCGKEKGS